MSFLRAIFVPLVIVAATVLLFRYVPALLGPLLPWEEATLRMSQIASSLIWLASAFFAVRLADFLFWKGIIEPALGHAAPRLMVQLGNVLIFFFALSGIITFSFDQSVAAFWTASGAFGLVIAFALRNLILDTFSGIAIHLESPFRVGDWVEFSDRNGYYLGRVEETNWRTTRLWTNDRNIVIIPNSVLTTSIFTNVSRPTEVQRLTLDFTMDFSVPPERVKRVLMAAVQSAIGEENGPVSDPAPDIRIEDVKTDGVDYRLYYFAIPFDGSPAKSHNVVLSHVLHHIDKSGLSFNYRKTDVFISNMPWRQKHWEHGKDRVRQLNKLSLFKALSDEERLFIAERMELEEIKPGTSLVEQGDKGDSMFILAEGLLQVKIRTDEGDDLKVAELEPGAFFGEKSLLTGEVRSATICAATEALVCKISKPVMAELFDRNDRIAEALSRAVVERDLANVLAIEQKAELDKEALLEEETDKFMDKLLSFFGNTRSVA